MGEIWQEILKDRIYKKSNAKKIYLDVPYIDKSLVKDNGAMWDKKKKQWFIYEEFDHVESFSKWFKKDKG